MEPLLVAQLDYIYFAYGLALFLLGSVCFSISRTGRLRTDWWLLGVFAVFHGAAEWLHLLELAHGDSPPLALVQASLLAASFLVLLEFARRTHQRLGETRVSPWIHAPVVLAVLGLAVIHGTSQLVTATRLLIATPSVIWTAVLFVRAARRTGVLGGGTPARRARLWSGVYFGAFGLAAGLVVPQAPFLPGAWPTHQAFLAWTGVPIQLVRALLVCGMALSIWALAITFDPRRSVLRKQRVLFWVMAASLAALLAAGWLFTSWLGRLNDQDTRNDAASSAAQAYAHLSDELSSADGGARAGAELLRRLHLAGRPVEQGRLDDVVDSLALTEDGWIVSILDASGTVIAASNRHTSGSFLGMDYSARPCFRAAREGRPGRYIGPSLATGLPGYYASQAVRRGDGTLLMVAVVKRELKAAQLGPSVVDPVYLVSADGRVLVSSREGHAGRALWAPPAMPAGGGAGDPLPPILDHAVQGQEWVTVDGRKRLAVRTQLQGSDWSLLVLRSEQTQLANRLLGILITLLFSTIVLGSFVAMQRQFGAEAALSDKRRLAEGRAREFARIADTDALTGLLNRFGFSGAFSRELERARRYTQPLSVVMIDLDHFKRVNDEHGHAAGDQVLTSVARLLEAQVRQSDLVVRWGGEEFVVVAPMTRLEGAAKLAEKLRAQLALTPRGPAGVVTGSFGVAELLPGDGVESVLYRADLALYRAKKGGRNAVVCSSAADAVVPELAGAPSARREGPAQALYAEVGFTPIDQEHRALAEALVALVALVGAGKTGEAQAALEALLAQTAAHFAHEERLMVAFDYSLLDRHQRSHELFLEDAGCYLQELQANGLTLVFRRWATGRLLEWFRLHVLAHDVALGHFLQNARAAEPPAR